MGQLTKNDFISCSLQCLTLNLNIAIVCKMFREGAFPRVKCQTQSTAQSRVLSVSSLLLHTSPHSTSHHTKKHHHLFMLPSCQGRGGRMLYFVNCIFYRFTRDSCSGKSQPGPAGRQSWILDHDEWMTFLGEQSHSRIDNNNSVSLCCFGWAAAVNSAYFAAISNPRIIVIRSRYLFALLIFSHYPLEAGYFISFHELLQSQGAEDRITIF